MRLVPAILLVFAWSGGLLCAQAQQTPPDLKKDVEAETVAPSKTPPPTGEAPQAAPAAEGLMEPRQVEELLHRLWLVRYRIDDLLTEVHPERWKLSDRARGSFQESLDALRKQMTALESWRSEFNARPESMYLAYMTHASIDAILPRLDGVARIITQRENSSLGAQFSQAGNQLFDLQQTLQPYLISLLRNQDQILLAAQTNLATCQNELGAAMRGRSEPAKLMKNIVPDFKGRRARKSPAAPAGEAPHKTPLVKPQAQKK